MRSALYAVAAMAAIGIDGALAQDAKPIEVLHSFSTEGDKNALAVYREQFVKEGGEWVDSTLGSGSQVRATLVRRILGGNPPGAAGHQGKKAFLELLETDAILDLSDVATAEGWDKVMSKEAFEDISYEGKVIAVPVQVQSVNFLFANAKILKEAGITSFPKTFDELFAALDKVRQTNPSTIPLAMGARENDMRRQFTASIVGASGVDVYRKVFVEKDASAVKTPEFRKGVESFRRLKDYVDPSWSNREWNDAADLIITDRAAFMFMGDWAKGAFYAAGKKPEQDFQCGFLQDIAVAAGSVFVFPKINDEGITKAQKHLAKVFLAKDLSVPFAVIKGTTPTRNDVDTSTLDSCSRGAASLHASESTSVPDDNRLISPQAIGEMQDLLKGFWASTDLSTDRFIERFAAIVASEN